MNRSIRSASSRGHPTTLDHLYAIKCLLNQYPLQIIAINFGIFMMLCGYSLKLCEGMLFIYNPGEITGF
jgi:hypothetical protein